MVALTSLDLSYNALSRLPESISRLTLLQQLHADNNR
jgi:Leucine-rich repeat (LRR) protein